MQKILIKITLCVFLFGYNVLFAQLTESPIKIFGYFQNEFEYQTNTDKQVRNYANSFALQQLNLFFQKDLGKNWTSLVNFEIINSFSSLDQQGGFKLDEAWVRFRSSKQFKLKLGLQIPIFNNLNVNKNRTPVLPYIIRPLVYETAFREDVQIDEYVPSRAYVQIYGFIPSHDWKIDHALYLGNTPNIMNIAGPGRSGLDTTSSVLIGGRLGIRYKELKMGVSAARDIVNNFTGYETFLFNQASLVISPSKFKKVQRIRIGSDLSYNYRNFSFESEYIQVTYDFDIPGFSYDKNFYYATVGYYITEPLYIYLSYWLNEDDYPPFLFENPITKLRNTKTGTVSINVPNIGLSYNFNDRIIIKAQYARVKVISSDKNLHPDRKFHFWATAISVFF